MVERARRSCLEAPTGVRHGSTSHEALVDSEYSQRSIEPYSSRTVFSALIAISTLTSLRGEERSVQGVREYSRKPLSFNHFCCQIIMLNVYLCCPMSYTYTKPSRRNVCLCSHAMLRFAPTSCKLHTAR